jgi:hypothetical protein
MQNKHGKTALCHAAERGDLVVVRALISSGASLDTRDKRGNTALASAELHGREEVAALLRETAAAAGAEDTLPVATVLGGVGGTDAGAGGAGGAGKAGAGGGGAGGGEGGDEKDQDGAGGGADAIVQATTEFELLRAFDAILAQPLPVTPEAAALSFAAMMPVASQKRAEVGEGVWTAKVAKAYGHMLREMKRRREAEEGGRA